LRTLMNQPGTKLNNKIMNNMIMSPKKKRIVTSVAEADTVVVEGVEVEEEDSHQEAVIIIRKIQILRNKVLIILVELTDLILINLYCKIKCVCSI
jgi:hypothetical protein